ncbi:MAG: hypothetical protein HRT93_02975 [Piscirickettsiaceae bacterium]|nr:hypothetical protein [Piscirickettsiaceae bacterium]
MSITVSGATVAPAVTYDKVHLASLQIEQPVFADDAQSAMYLLRVSYRMYGVVNGVRYYDEAAGLESVSIPDYLGTAMVKAGNGDMDLINALGSIELAVANIIEDQTGLATAVA